MNKRTNAPLFKTGFLAGLIAGVVATGVMLLLNLFTAGISLPEVAGSAITALMPPSVFESLHQLIGADAKRYLFDIIVVGQCLVFALFGGVFGLVSPILHKDAQKQKDAQRTLEAGIVRPYHGLLFALALWLLVGLVFLPLTGGGVFGTQLALGFVNTAIRLAVVGVVFDLLFVLCQNWLIVRAIQNAKAAKEGVNSENDGLLGRRTIVQRGMVIAGIGILGIGIWEYITQGVSNTAAPVAKLVHNFKSKIVPPPIPNYGKIQETKFLSPEITSNDQFYIVSKNLFSDPTVDGSTWHLTVDGDVDHPFTLNYQQLLALPMQKQYESLMCISNDVGGQYMSNALWEGVRLKDLLERAGVKAGAIKVVFYAADDYSDSIHLDKAMEPTTLLAVRMNGATLPQGHGFPVRMLVPGIYGMKHCKWLNRIQVVQQDYQGYWQQRGWSDAAPVRMTARIDTPLRDVNVPVNQTTYIGGVAFSGNKGISEVDVSLDGGTSWHIATLERPFSDLTWVRWQYPWQPTARGTYTLVVRAIDLEGNVQDPNVAPPAPDGSSGYDSFDIPVV